MKFVSLSLHPRAGCDIMISGVPMIRTIFIFILMAGCVVASYTLASDSYGKQSQQMLKEIDGDALHASSALGRNSIDRRVMDVIAKVPRHEFVPAYLRSSAYANVPLPIGHGQTISQPFIVALMTDLLMTKKDDVVLEVGTGSGYQAAVLSELVRRVYTIEVIKELGEQAREQLSRLGYKNVEVRIADGYFGWEDHAPFDSIIVTAAAGHVPPPLIRQLKPGGRIVIPVGGPYQVQMLMVVTKDASGRLKTQQVLPVRFVPLTGKARKE
jgi:protein-L-isoaspartate(D-aspartate) O-methyltransferase